MCDSQISHIVRHFEALTERQRTQFTTMMKLYPEWIWIPL